MIFFCKGDFLCSNQKQYFIIFHIYTIIKDNNNKKREYFDD